MTVPVSREVVEGRLRQGSGEKIAYQLTTTPWGGTPTSPALAVDDLTTGETVTSSVVSGSTTAAGDIITTGRIQTLTAGHLYRAEVTFISGGNTFVAYFEILAED